MLGGGAGRATSPRRPERRTRSQCIPGCCVRIDAVISKELLEVLACPKCKQRLQLSDDGSWLICGNDRLRYPIVDGIPVMLVEEAETY